MKEKMKVFLKIMLIVSVCCLLASKDVMAAKKITGIAFKKYSGTLTISKGEKCALKVKITPSKAENKKLNWKSSKKKIVSVTKKGVITGKKNGTAKITVSTTDGSKKKITLKVTVGTKVSDLKYTNVDSLTELKVGSSYKMNVEVIPGNASNKKLEWTTSDSNIATVNSSGTVKAKSNGTVTITAKATDGTNKKISKKIDVVTYVKSISIVPKTSSVYWSALGESGLFVMLGKTVFLKTEITPDTATDKTLVWTSGNPDVAIVSAQGDVTAVGNGIAVITAQAVDNGGKKKNYYIYSSALDQEDCEYIAHRGLCEVAPENSMAAFKLALESNFDSIEFDIWGTVDQEFVVSHNQSLESACGVDVKVTDLTLSQATSYRITIGNNVNQYQNEYIPSLNQVLDLAENYPDKKLSIELKQSFSKEMLEKLLTDINQRNMQDRVKLITFSSANFPIIRSLEELGGDKIALEYLTSSPSEQAVNFCIKYNADYGAKYVGLTEAQVREIHSKGLKVNVWTVSNYIEAYHMVHTMKVDYLTSDYQFFR
jgi:uncharacterized protein YjdB/glycerophosphoryl diester phosphodiesterase